MFRVSRTHVKVDPMRGQWSHTPTSDTPLCRRNFPSFVCTLLQIPYLPGHHTLGGGRGGRGFEPIYIFLRMWFLGQSDWGEERMVWRNISCLSHIPIAGMKWLTREDHGCWFGLLASAASCLHSALLGNSKSKYYQVACLYSFILSISVSDKISFFYLESKYDLMKYVTFKYTPSSITVPCNDDFLTVVHC